MDISGVNIKQIDRSHTEITNEKGEKNIKLGSKEYEANISKLCDISNNEINPYINEVVDKVEYIKDTLNETFKAEEFNLESLELQEEFLAVEAPAGSQMLEIDLTNSSDCVSKMNDIIANVEKQISISVPKFKELIRKEKEFIEKTEDKKDDEINKKEKEKTEVNNVDSDNKNISE